MDKKNYLYLKNITHNNNKTNQAIRSAIKVQLAELADIVQLENVFNAFR